MSSRGSPPTANQVGHRARSDPPVVRETEMVGGDRRRRRQGGGRLQPGVDQQRQLVVQGEPRHEMGERRVGARDDGAAGAGEGAQDALHGVDAALAVEAVGDLAGAVGEALPDRGRCRDGPSGRAGRGGRRCRSGGRADPRPPAWGTARRPPRRARPRRRPPRPRWCAIPPRGARSLSGVAPRAPRPTRPSPESTDGPRWARSGRPRRSAWVAAAPICSVVRWTYSFTASVPRSAISSMERRMAAASACGRPMCGQNAAAPSISGPQQRMSGPAIGSDLVCSRHRRIHAGSLPVSRTVVTPAARKLGSIQSERCVWQSIRPGSSVQPGSRRTSIRSGNAPTGTMPATRSPSITTAWACWVLPPSKTTSGASAQRSRVTAGLTLGPRAGGERRRRGTRLGSVRASGRRRREPSPPSRPGQ